ncbi:unnamed protein product [Lampetra fluviatilis]
MGGDGRDGGGRFPVGPARMGGSPGEAEEASTGAHGPGIGARWGVRALPRPRLGPALAFVLGCALSAILAVLMHIAVSWSLRPPETAPCTSSTIAPDTSPSSGSTTQGSTQAFPRAPSPFQ